MAKLRILALAVSIAAACGAASAQPAAVLDPAQRAQDIAAFRKGFFDLDRAYAPAARAQAQQRLAALEAAKGPMDAARLTVALCQVAALADNGHSTCYYPRPPVVTLGFTALEGGYAVTAAPPGQAELLGARLVAIDGKGMEAIRPALRSLFGGVNGRRDLRGADTLGRPALLHALDLAKTGDTATYRLRLIDGRTAERRLGPTKRGADWATPPAAWALAEPDKAFRWRDAPELDAVVAQMRHNHDEPNQKAADFLKDAEDARVRLGRKNIVLDLRPNGGGDFLSTRDVMLAWPARLPPGGRIVVVMGAETFSAGISSAAYLKQAGGDRVVLAGEAPGDRMSFFAEGRLAPLPNTGAEVLPATQRDDYANGCRGYDDCFVTLAQPGSPTGTPQPAADYLDKTFGRAPLTIPNLDPQIRAPWTVADYVGGRDTAMDAIAACLKRGG
jgi:hypothetical protein